MAGARRSSLTGVMSADREQAAVDEPGDDAGAGDETEHVAGRPVGREQEQPVRGHRKRSAGRARGICPDRRVVVGAVSGCTLEGIAANLGRRLRVVTRMGTGVRR